MSESQHHTNKLRSEAGILSWLLQKFRDDLQFKAARDDAHLVYFVDAHDLDAYIAADSPGVLTGFLFEAEHSENCAALDSDPKLTNDYKLKSDQIMHRLLFDGEKQVGLLPSHADEIQDRITYYSAHYQQEKLKHLLDARNEYLKLRRNPMALQLISERKIGEQATPEQRKKALDLLKISAPALIMMLRKAPETPKDRIRNLLHQSDLTGLSEYAWEKLGFTKEEAQSMRALRPSEAHVGRWRSFLNASDARKVYSLGANRIDAEALACMDVLRQALRNLKKDNVRVVLVTRVMSLIRATLEERSDAALKSHGLEDAEFLRHPRMLRLPASVPRLSEEIIATLAVALDTFVRHLRADARDPAPNEIEIEEARKIFVNALHDFESASFALDLRKEASTPQIDLDKTKTIDFEKLLHWFANDDAFEQALREEVDMCVQAFGFQTYSLGQVQVREHIEALIESHASLPRSSVRPLICGAPGPVYFSSSKVREAAGSCENLEDLLGNLQGKSAERYLAWALLHACRARWDLARIYARSAIDVVRLALAKIDTFTLNEANLLLAQVRRLGGIGRESNMEGVAKSRLEFAHDQLPFKKGQSDPRMAMELAAQLLEYSLTVSDKSANHRARLDEGLILLASALKICERRADDFTASRCLALLLAYGLAAQRRELYWREGELLGMIQSWHRALVEVMQRLNGKLTPDEIPRRVFAMDIIGYILAYDAETSGTLLMHRFAQFNLETRRAVAYLVPAEKRHFVPELHLQLMASHDEVGKLIASELGKLVEQQDKFRHWELVYAPIWPSGKSKEILATELTDPWARAEAENALDILAAVAGPSQRGVDPAHRRAFSRAAKSFEKALEKLRAHEHVVPSRVDFLLRMERCYALLLHALVAADPADRVEQLHALVASYDLLCREYPTYAITHFRLHVIYYELAKCNEKGAEHQMNEQLALAIAKLDKDEVLKDTPNHWIRSTICRRQAAPLFKNAKNLREKLFKGNASPDFIQQYLDAVRLAFASVYNGLPFGKETYSDASKENVFLRLEAERRINNVVFGASLFLDVLGDYTQLHESFRRDDLLFLTRCLHPDDINSMDDEDIVHTVGCAYHVLGETDLAMEARDRFLRLISDQGFTPESRPGILELIGDALGWGSDPEGHLARAVS
jgi:hypothetical protein